MFKRTREFKQRGFTLVELLVVIAIFAIILTIGLINYRRAAEIQALNNAAESLASILREARTKALAGDRVGLAEDVGNITAFGVYVDDENTYTLFADRDGDGWYISTTDDGTGHFVPDTSPTADPTLNDSAVEKIKTVDLPNKVVFKSEPDVLHKNFTFFAAGGQYIESGVIKLTLTNDLERFKCIKLSETTGKVETGMPCGACDSDAECGSDSYSCTDDGNAIQKNKNICNLSTNTCEEPVTENLDCAVTVTSKCLNKPPLNVSGADGTYYCDTSPICQNGDDFISGCRGVQPDIASCRRCSGACDETAGCTAEETVECGPAADTNTYASVGALRAAGLCSSGSESDFGTTATGWTWNCGGAACSASLYVAPPVPACGVNTIYVLNYPENVDALVGQIDVDALCSVGTGYSSLTINRASLEWNCGVTRCRGGLKWCGDGGIPQTSPAPAAEICDKGTDNGVECDAPYGGSCQYCKDDCSGWGTARGKYCGNTEIDIISVAPRLDETCELNNLASSWPINNTAFEFLSGLPVTNGICRAPSVAPAAVNQDNCTYCGDNIKQQNSGEDCDAGTGNLNIPNADCRPNCTLPDCEDGIFDGESPYNEECGDTAGAHVCTLPDICSTCQCVPPPTPPQCRVAILIHGDSSAYYPPPGGASDIDTITLKGTKNGVAHECTQNGDNTTLPSACTFDDGKPIVLDTNPRPPYLSSESFVTAKNEYGTEYPWNYSPALPNLPITFMCTGSQSSGATHSVMAWFNHLLTVGVFRGEGNIKATANNSLVEINCDNSVANCAARYDYSTLINQTLVDSDTGVVIKQNFKPQFITLLATPVSTASTGFFFGGWIGSACSSASIFECRFWLSMDREVQAKFYKSRLKVIVQDEDTAANLGAANASGLRVINNPLVADINGSATSINLSGSGQTTANYLPGTIVALNISINIPDGYEISNYIATGLADGAIPALNNPSLGNYTLGGLLMANQEATVTIKVKKKTYPVTIKLISNPAGGRISKSADVQLGTVNPTNGLFTATRPVCHRTLNHPDTDSCVLQVPYGETLGVSPAGNGTWPNNVTFNSWIVSAGFPEGWHCYSGDSFPDRINNCYGVVRGDSNIIAKFNRPVTVNFRKYCTTNGRSGICTTGNSVTANVTFSVPPRSYTDTKICDAAHNCYGYSDNGPAGLTALEVPIGARVTLSASPAAPIWAWWLQGICGGASGNTSQICGPFTVNDDTVVNQALFYPTGVGGSCAPCSLYTNY